MKQARLSPCRNRHTKLRERRVKCRIQWNDRGDPEIATRLRPLREHWEARGPGMLHYCQKRVPWLTYPESVEVRLTRPIHGGYGRVIDGQTIEFEAILANAHPQLPEVVRLAWLVVIAQSGSGSGAIASTQQALGLVPLVLDAAEYVELARCDELTLELALDAWWKGDSPRGPLRSANSLHAWWTDTGRTAISDSAAWKSVLAQMHSTDA